MVLWKCLYLNCSPSHEIRCRNVYCIIIQIFQSRAFNLHFLQYPAVFTNLRNSQLYLRQGVKDGKLYPRHPCVARTMEVRLGSPEGRKKRLKCSQKNKIKSLIITRIKNGEENRQVFFPINKKGLKGRECEEVTMCLLINQ